jgi:ABC-type spermidine/putrescine transport system permease subunit II
MSNTSKVGATFGESLVAILLASVASSLSAIAGFVAAIAFCELAFTGESTEFALLLAPLTAIVAGVIVFIVVYRWLVRYGNPSA